METISIQIPGELYASLFNRFGGSTTATIAAHLAQLADWKMTPEPQVEEVTTAYRRPGVETITGRVWEIADQIQKQSGQADRETVIKGCMAEGININTASTQFSYWRKANP